MSRYDTDDGPGLVAPTLKDMADLRDGGRVCGNCHHFDFEEGQRRWREQKLATQLVSDYGWKLEYVGDMAKIGLCGQHENGGVATDGTRRQLFTGKLHKACDSYTPRRS